MTSVKQSFLSNLIGRSTYADFKIPAKYIVAIGTCILIVVYTLSCFFYWKSISSLLNIITGSSLLFIAYLAAVILVLDFEVNVDEPEMSYWNSGTEHPKPMAYYFTIVWVIVLALLAIFVICYSDDYRKHYAFECETFLVDKKLGVYHLDYKNDCEIATASDNLVRLKGHELEEYGYTLCEWCDEWAEDLEEFYETDKYVRR